MTKPARLRYSEQDARTRFTQALNDALSAPPRCLTMTATMKRRALKRKFGNPKKNAGKANAVPAVLFTLQRDRTDRSES
jgi:hypothetical protein